MEQPFARAWWRIWPAHRYEIHPARHAEIFKDPDMASDPYRAIAKQLARARPFEAAWLLHRRSGSDDGRQQMQVYQALLNARALYWSRLAVICASLSLPISVAAIVVAS